jgi:hypothetical protein
MISTEMTIWLAVVGVASVGMLLGIFALTKRINAIDERLFDLHRLEIALSRGFSAAVANESSEVTAIKLHLYQLKRQQNEILRRLGALSDSLDADRIQHFAIQSLHRD